MKYTKVVWVAVAILLLSIGEVSAYPSGGKKQAKKQVTLPLDPSVKVGKLPNGFTYYIRRNTEPKNRVTLYLANKVGSILENDNQQGLAHFIEHMSFNGTKHFPKNELVSYLQKAGVRFGGDLNAYTSFDETVYQLPLPTDNPELLKNGFQIMRDWAQDDLLDSVEINKERGVILEEKRLGKNASQRLQYKYLPVILNKSRYSNRLPIGTEEILNNFRPQTLTDFYKTWYRPDLQALIVVGDVDVAATEKTIIALFSDLKLPKAPKPRIKYTVPLLQKNQFLIATDNEYPTTAIQVFVKHQATALKTVEDYHQSILRSIFNFIVSERFDELSKQASPPFIEGGGSIGSFLANIDVLSASVVAKPGELERGFKAVWTEMERLKKFGFTQSELNRAKEALMQSMESVYKEKDKTQSESYTNEYLNLFLKGDAAPGIEYEYKLYQNSFPKITLAELNGLIKKYLVDINRDIVVLGSTKDSTTLPTEKVVNQWMLDVQKSTINSYIDKSVDKPLMTQQPVAGKIVSEKKQDALGLIEYTLSNGVKVNLKPTNFKNDEISFHAFSSGGTSLYSDADYESAIRASSLVGYSGLADFNLVQLGKYLTGKQVRVSPYIGERTEGLTGYSTPKDFETALQLVYLYFTQPRKDVEVYKGVLSQERATLSTRGNDPAAVFADTVNTVLGNYSLRRSAPSIARLDKIDLDRAFDIYKDRFADASDFTFTFVGNLDLEKVKPLLEKYLGSLPAIHRTESARDLGIHIPAGKINKVVYKGQDPKSTVRLVFSGEYNYSNDENNLLDALAEVLTIKLTERLREDESGVYGVEARASYAKYPHNRFSFSVMFGCGPENTEKLINSALDEINKLRQNGPSLVDVNKVLAEERRSTEVQLKENNFWLNYLTNQFQNNENLEQILSYQDDLNKITPESIKICANKYLDGTNFARLILYPDKK
ncbi:peptidase M16 domain protein [Paludibacter propionicigenes WB4]|uniref:Peptidase M16 domain protein n=1 Tax=Paludibacter propionicigenes (strain DSM 17365 / JCM 13257 / WB4) TaxID=694427 RepID=E4T7G1_PALPW|nr:M16 family metallopeptidase [Paludibacter propionicigenes]ADQ80655.1 peptidase M16 domain protein [Paludibacter propionicigenes WB4]